MRINHEETKKTKKRPEKTFVLFVSSRLILRRSLRVGKPPSGSFFSSRRVGARA
jgi:hypothetical protein